MINPEFEMNYLEYCDSMYSKEFNKLSISDLKNKKTVMNNLLHLSPSMDVSFMIDKIEEEIENRTEH